MNQRDKMMFLMGQIEAIQYPLVWKKEAASHGYYDLIESMSQQYKAIVKDIYPDFKDD